MKCARRMRALSSPSGPAAGAHRQRQAGMLLMEVLIAVSILGIGGVMVVRCILNSLDSLQMSREYTKAMFLTSGKMEEVVEEYAFTSRKRGESSEGDYEDLGAGRDYAYKTEVDLNDDRLVYEIRVTTLWVHKGSVKKLELYSETPARRVVKDYAK
jgi:hypothetical protein